MSAPVSTAGHLPGLSRFVLSPVPVDLGQGAASPRAAVMRSGLLRKVTEHIREVTGLSMGLFPGASLSKQFTFFSWFQETNRLDRVYFPGNVPASREMERRKWMIVRHWAVTFGTGEKKNEFSLGLCSTVVKQMILNCFYSIRC